MKFKIVFLLLLFAFGCVMSLKAQDTITVQTFTWDSASRNAWFQFPEIPTGEIERINLIYNMRCHDAAVGVGSVGCREWDYSCNTFVTDTNRLDSVLATQKKYVIPNFSDPEFFYSNSPTVNCIQFKQRQAAYTSMTMENSPTFGDPKGTLSFNKEAGRFFFIYQASELLAKGLKAGNIHAMRWQVAQSGELEHLRIKMKNTKWNTLNENTTDLENLKEVYFSNTDFVSGSSKLLVFYSEFVWDGTSNILVECSFNKSKSGNMPMITHNGMDNEAIGSNHQVYSLAQNGLSGFSVDADKMKNINNEISISFWAYGDQEALPANTAVFEGVDDRNQRQALVHLPWSNGSIYWDCGNDGSGYDRIEKPANPKEYEGQWTHWTFTKNATTGLMYIYKNGSLWHSGSNKKKPIDIQRMQLLSNIDNQLSYFGRLSHFAVWNVALDSNTIKNWILHPGNANHPNYNSLLYYFPMNDGTAKEITDASPNPASIISSDSLNWYVEHGRNHISNFQKLNGRPITIFTQGVPIGFSIKENIVLEEFPLLRIPVTEYHIVKGQPEVKNKYLVYPGGDVVIKDENGELIDFKTNPTDGIFTLEDIKYQRYIPAKFEILSLVTPYGNNLDLGKEGKTFVFDITDYAPILRGSKRLSLELGGEYQEEMDIKFQFIKGRPAREVKDIQNVYAFQRGWFGNILNNEVFEPRNIILSPNGHSFKLRTTVTGHEQNGEFTSRSHFLKVDGNKGSRKFDFTVWKECADNPIYPQGGTWIFDRAGWCPGAASDVHSFDITALVEAGRPARIDYGLNGQNLDAANYLVSCQLVSYGPPAYSNDAGIEAIVKPNSARVEFERFNPSCSRPSIQIKNFGTTDITQIKVEYGVVNGNKLEHEFKGQIKPLETRSIDLPVADMSFWTSSPDSTFQVTILQVNQQTDENLRNNVMRSSFKLVRKFDYDPVFEIRTNNVAGDNGFRIKDMNGNVLIQKLDLPAVTTTQENLNLPNGCYTIEVDDASDDGLSFWFFANLGNGNASLKRRVNNVLLPVITFRADFGRGFKYDFVISKPNANNDSDIPYLLTIFPNPTTDYLNIAWQSNAQAIQVVELYDLQGRKIFAQNIQTNNPTQNTSVNIENVPVGLYQLIIYVDGKKISRKLIVE